MKTLFISLLLSITILGFSQKNPDLAKTPPMGWNSWNWFGKKEINEQVVKETIDVMVKEGLVKAGYNYLVIDGGWRDVKLGENGELLAHPVKFPGGIKALADYAHANGMKFGLHVVPGTHDCGMDHVGGYGHEEVHVRQFVEWGVDFIKLDLCKLHLDLENIDRAKNDWTEEIIYDQYTKWSNLLLNSGRDILFSISAYDFRPWNPEFSNMSRTTGDIACRFSGGAIFHNDSITKKHFIPVITVAELNNQSAKYAGNGYWNDPDMMVTGGQGLTENEEKVHFGLWCIMSSPLILGNDVRLMTPAEKNLLLNEELIAVNQDATEQGIQIKKDKESQIWAKKLKDGKIAVLLINLNPNESKTITLNFNDLGLKGKVKTRDLFNKKNIGSFKSTISQTIEPNSGSFLLLNP
jgi:alpha-galactosidase